MRHVICFGNALHGDDGFGPAVFARLSAASLPPDVRLFEAGTRGLDALALFEGCREAIVVDALAPGGHPGKITEPAAQGLVPEAGAGHAAGVGHLLAALTALGLPLPHLIVAEAASVKPFVPGLSPPVQEAVVRVTASVCRMLEDACA